MNHYQPPPLDESASPDGASAEESPRALRDREGPDRAHEAERERYFDHLGEVMLEHLRAHPEGRNEVELMAAARAAGVAGYGERPPPGDTLALFRAHFILFHALYRLRERLAAERRWGVEIHCMKTRLLPSGDGGGSGIGRHDPLRDYYLDLDQLAHTDREEVDALLAGFWQRVGAHDQRAEALAVLELEEPAGLDEIKRQYRRLASRHHPDRGGDKGRLQAINAAMETLARLY